MNWNKNFALLLIGQSFANIGDVLYIVSVISVIFNVTNSATASSFVPFTITTCMFVSSLLTPVLVGRVNLKWLLAWSQIGKTILLGALGLMVVVVTASNYYFVYLIIGLVALLDGCANPIRQTLIPYYVKPGDLLKANGIAETVTQIIQAVMWFVGSLFLLMLSPQQLIWLVGCLFVLSSVMLCLLETVSHKTAEPKGRLAQLKEGWQTLSNTPVLKKIAIIDTLENMSGTVWIAAILYVFVHDALHVGEEWWGFINGAFCLGLILGSVYCIQFSGFVEKKLSTFIFVGAFNSFLVTIFFSLTSNSFVALFLSLLIGIFGQIKNIPQQTVIQTSVPKEELSTVYTSLGAIGTGMFGIGSLVMGVLADWFGVRMVFVLSGVILALASAIVYQNKQLFSKKVLQK